MDDYRRAQQLKWQQKEQKKHKQRAEREQIAKEEKDRVLEFLYQLALNVDALEGGDIVQKLQIIREKLAENIKAVEQHKRLEDLQTSIISLIRAVNLISEQQRQTPAHVKLIGEIMSDIIDISKVDVDIQLMDTTEDARHAEELQSELRREAQEEDMEYARRLQEQLSLQEDEEYARGFERYD